MCRYLPIAVRPTLQVSEIGYSISTGSLSLSRFLSGIALHSIGSCIYLVHSMTMATRFALRGVSRRFSSGGGGGGGKLLGEEEKAAENVFIKKTEQEKLEKLARKGPKTEEKVASSSEGSAANVNATASTSATAGGYTEKVSTDNHRNYAVVAGAITALGALGWYLKSGEKKKEVQD